MSNSVLSALPHRSDTYRRKFGNIIFFGINFRLWHELCSRIDRSSRRHILLPSVPELRSSRDCIFVYSSIQRWFWSLRRTERRDSSLRHPHQSSSTGAAYLYGLSPDAANRSCVTGFNTTLSVPAENGTLVGASDPADLPPTAYFFTSPKNGGINFNGDGSFYYTPNTVYAGSDGFFATVSDGKGGLSDPAYISLAVAAPIPTLTTVTPSTLTAGSATATLTLTGTEFVRTSQAFWNGTTALATTVVSPTQITVIVPAPPLNVVANASVTIVNPAPGGGTSTAVTVPVQNALSSLSLFSTATASGNTVTLTVKIDRAAPAGGLAIALTSSNSAVAALTDNSGKPITSVTVPSGKTSTSCRVKTYPVLAPTPVALSGSVAGVTKSVTLTVTAPALLSLSVTPSSVKGGTSAAGTVKLTGIAAADTIITLAKQCNTITSYIWRCVSEGRKQFLGGTHVATDFSPL